MICRRVEPLLSRHREGILSEREAAAVSAHLADCLACRRTRAELIALQSDLRDLPAPASSPDLPRRAVEQWRAEGRGQRVQRRLYLRVAACAGAAAVVAGAFGLAAIRWRGAPAEERIARKAAPESRARGRLPLALPEKRLARISAGAGTITPGGGPALTPGPSPNDWERGAWQGRLVSHPSPRLGRGAGGEGPRVPADDLAYLNVDPALSAQPWAAVPVDEWAAIEARLRRSVRVRDDFVTIPFPRIAAAPARQVADAVESYKREAAVVDSRLFQKVTLQAKAQSFDQFCRELERQTGIRIEAGRGVADEKVTAFIKERPLRQIMRHVSRLFGYTWLRSGKPGELKYELAQDLKSQLLEEELRNRDRNEALIAMDRQMQALRPYLEMTPEQIRAKAEAATAPEEKELLQKLSGFGWGPLQMYFRLSPEEMLALRSEQALVYSSQPEAKDRPLPAELRQPILGVFSADHRLWRQGDSHGFGPPSSVPAGAEQYEPKALPEVRATVSLQLGRHELGQTALMITSGFGAWGGAMSRSDDLAVGISPSVASPGNAKVNAALKSDPPLQPVVSWKPEASCRHGVDYPRAYRYSRADMAVERQRQFEEAAKAEREPAPVSVADVLAAIHHASGIDILSDHYTRLYPAGTASVEKIRLFDALNRTADPMRYRWRKEDGMLLFRSAGYFNDRLKEVPNRLLERWAASIREHGRLTLDDLVEIAGLNNAQLDSKLIAEGAVRCYGLKGWGLARNGSLRPHLRFLASLTREQRQLALGPAGLSFRQMNAGQQQQYLSTGWGNASSGIEPESLAEARLRVDFALPGEFEWTPEREGEFPGARRVRAATRDLALAAARQADPAATAADILPTAAVLQVEYSLGPRSDGALQFAVVGPNWSDGGIRPGTGNRGIPR